MLGGGRSSEHEVSLASAASVAAGLREAGHEVLEVEVGRDGVWRTDGGASSASARAAGWPGIDVVFPALHGPFGEDGTVQGLLELLGVPYVGAGVLASAACMDKIVFKELMAQRRAAAGRLPRGHRRATGSSTRTACCAALVRARAARVRQAGSARLLGRDRPRAGARTSCARRWSRRSAMTRW